MCVPVRVCVRACVCVCVCVYLYVCVCVERYIERLIDQSIDILFLTLRPVRLLLKPSQLLRQSENKSQVRVNLRCKLK